MENLRESVYECTLAVEAHMICDLLAQAGISSRVDGEFLAGAWGSVGPANTVWSTSALISGGWSDTAVETPEDFDLLFAPPVIVPTTTVLVTSLFGGL